MRLIMSVGRFGFVSEDLPLETVDLIHEESKKAPITIDGVHVATIPAWVVESGLAVPYGIVASLISDWVVVVGIAFMAGIAAGMILK